MPLIRMETNVGIYGEKIRKLQVALAAAMSGLTGMPAGEFGVELAGDRRMRMAEGNEPIAHIEVRGIEFPKDRAREMTEAICPVIRDIMTIADKNIYIAVVSNRNSMWRVNGDLK